MLNNQEYKKKYLKYKKKYLIAKNNIISGGKNKKVKGNKYFDIYINVKLLENDRPISFTNKNRNEKHLEDLQKKYEKKYLETEMFYNFNEYFKIIKVINIYNWDSKLEKTKDAFNGIILIAEWIKPDKKYPINKKFNIGKSIYDELLIDEKDIYKNIFVTNKNKKKVYCNRFKNDKYQKIYEDCLKCILKYKKPTFRSVMFEDSCSGKNRY